MEKRKKGMPKQRSQHVHKIPPQTLGGSFSAVSKPPIARVGTFFSIFRDLQESHAFAPRQNQNLSIFSKFRTISMMLMKFSRILNKFSSNFAGISANFTEFQTNSECS